MAPKEKHVMIKFFYFYFLSSCVEFHLYYCSVLFIVCVPRVYCNCHWFCRCLCNVCCYLLKGKGVLEREWYRCAFVSCSVSKAPGGGGVPFLVMLVDIGQWRPGIGCFRVLTCRSERFSCALSMFSVLLQILKLYPFCCLFYSHSNSYPALHDYSPLFHRSSGLYPVLFLALIFQFVLMHKDTHA